MAANRMHRGLVALSASAVAAVYMAGYLRTQSADATIGAAAVPTIVPTVVVVAAAVPPPPPAAAPAVTPTTVPRSASTSAGTYKDGTYSGQGSSRRGDVWVSVQITAGRIANVTIARSTLQYPLRDIANLPSQVVQRQSAQVDLVSRATYSSQAFRGAILQALSQAG